MPPSFCGCPDKKKKDERQSSNQISEQTKKNFRKFLKCPCDSKADSDYVGRITLDQQQTLIPIQNLKFINRITRSDVQLNSCPWFNLYNNPLITSIFDLQHKHQLNPNVFNDSLPNILYDAFILYQSKVTTVKNYFWEEEQKKRESERKMRDQQLKPNRR